MPMREQYSPRHQFDPVHFIYYSALIAARIDNNPGVIFLIFNEIAICLKWADNHNIDLHITHNTINTKIRGQDIYGRRIVNK